MASSPERAKTLAFGLLAVLLVGGLAAIAHATRDEPALASGVVPLRVTGPEREVIFDGSVGIDNLTAHSVLVAASELGGFDVKTRRYAGLGLYVKSIAGIEAEGASGWVYEVERNDAWVSGDRAADRFAIAPHERVRWFWNDAPPQE